MIYLVNSERIYTLFQEPHVLFLAFAGLQRSVFWSVVCVSCPALLVVRYAAESGVRGLAGPFRHTSLVRLSNSVFSMCLPSAHFHLFLSFGVERVSPNPPPPPNQEKKGCKLLHYIYILFKRHGQTGVENKTQQYVVYMKVIKMTKAENE